MGQPLENKLVSHLTPIRPSHEDHIGINMNESFGHLQEGKVLVSMMWYPEIIKEKTDRLEYMKIKNLSIWKTIKRRGKKKRKKYMIDNCLIWSQMCKELLQLIKKKMNISLEKIGKGHAQAIHKENKYKWLKHRKRYSFTLTNNLSNANKNECHLPSVNLATHENPGLARVWTDRC